MKLGSGNVSFRLGSTTPSKIYLGATEVWTSEPAFSPTNINGLQLWLDSSDASTLYDATSGGSLVAADGTIARWEDKSGNNRHGTQSTSASRPIRKTSIRAGKDVVRFDGSNDFFNISSLNGLENSYTFFGVARRNNVNANFCFAGVAQAGGSNYFPAFARIRASENTYVLAANGGSPYDGDNHSVYSINNAFGSSDWFQATQISSPSSASLRLNETSLSPLATSSAAQGNNFTAIGMFGGDAGVQGFTNSDFAEILYYNSVLSNENIQLIESYLKNKWSIGIISFPYAVMLTTGSSYTVPAGATSMKAWTIGSGGNTDRGAGGTAYKTWSVNGGDSVSYSVGAAAANSNYDTLGNNTTLTYNGTTITGFGGGRRANGTTGSIGGEFSGGDGGANGGAGGYFGAGNWSNGAVGGNTTIGTGQGTRHQATDIDGLFAVLDLLGIDYTLDPTYTYNTNPNIFGAGTQFNKYAEFSSGGIGGGNGFNTGEQRETGAVILYFT